METARINNELNRIILSYDRSRSGPGYDLQTTDEACDLAPESTI